MAGSTVSNLIQLACDEAKTPRPALVVNPTDTGDRQYVALLIGCCRELRASKYWTQLKREHVFQLEPFRRNYQLPIDFWSMLPATLWDRALTQRELGPLSDHDFVALSLSGVNVSSARHFRLFGPDINRNSGEGQFMIDPVPSAEDAGQLVSFEYVSKNLMLPPDWAPGAGYLLNDYVHVGGRIYKCSQLGTSSTVPPTMILGRGRSGSAYFTALTVPAWVGSTYYAPFDYVSNTGVLYRCVTGGASASSGGPTGTGTAITEGTVTWEYIAVSIWTGSTSFAFDDHTSAGAVTYRCTGAGTTAKDAPTWTTTEITDNTAKWNDYRSLWYEQPITANDQVCFDDEVIVAGLKWRFKKERGMEFDKEEYETLKSSGSGRFNAGMKLCMGLSGPLRPMANMLEGSWPVGTEVFK